MANRTIFEYAAPLYRIALTAFLRLQFDHCMPSMSDAADFGTYVAARNIFLTPQRIAEEALQTAVKPVLGRGATSRSARRRRLQQPD